MQLGTDRWALIPLPSIRTSGGVRRIAAIAPRSVLPDALHAPEDVQALDGEVMKDIDKYPVLGEFSVLFAVEIHDQIGRAHV